MSTRDVRNFDYVNHPYQRVRDVLAADAAAVFAAATRAAARRVQSVASELHVDVGGIRVGTEVAISVGEVREESSGPASSRVTRIALDWESAQHLRLFPLMTAQLAVYPLTPTETQLDFTGRYEPPLGALGGAIDAVVGHRIAEASVHQFVTEVAQYLRETLGRT